MYFRNFLCEVFVTKRATQIEPEQPEIRLLRQAVLRAAIWVILKYNLRDYNLSELSEAGALYFADIAIEAHLKYDEEDEDEADEEINETFSDDIALPWCISFIALKTFTLNISVLLFCLNVLSDCSGDENP